MIASLAFRNLFRNLRRTVITSMAVVVGVAVLILGWGLVGGLEENILRGEEDARSGHVLLKPSDYPDESLGHPSEDSRPIPDALTAALGQAPVQAWTSRLVFDAQLVVGPDRVRVTGLGYEPDRDPAVFPRETWHVEGRWPEGPTEIALASGLASTLGAKVGDKPVVQARTVPGAQNALPYEVVGIVHTRNAGLDGLLYWQPVEAAEALLATKGNRTLLGVRLARRSQAEAAAQQLTLEGWTATTARHEARDKLALNAFRKRAISVVVLILMAIAGTGIANTITMAAYERVKEVGTLRALGFGAGQIRSLFLIEGALMGICAAVVGATVGSAIVSWFAVNGIDFGNIAAASQAVGSTVLYTQLSPVAVVAATCFGLGISLVASLAPARFAANLNPADAVRAD